MTGSRQGCCDTDGGHDADDADAAVARPNTGVGSACGVTLPPLGWDVNVEPTTLSGTGGSVDGDIPGGRTANGGFKEELGRTGRLAVAA